MKPLESLRGHPTICRKAVTAWISALVVALPQIFIFVQSEQTIDIGNGVNVTVRSCGSQGYTAQWQRKTYLTFMTGYVFVAPAAIMCFCYVRIIGVVFRRMASGSEPASVRYRFTSSLKKQPERDVVNRSDCCRDASEPLSRQSLSGSAQRLALPKKLVSNSRRNVVKMTLSVILAFVVCWSPYFFITLVRCYSDYRIKLKHALSVAEMMAMLHSALNPILYGLFSTRSVRTAASKLCGRWHADTPTTTNRFNDVTLVSTDFLEENGCPVNGRRGSRWKSFSFRASKRKNACKDGRRVNRRQTTFI